MYSFTQAALNLDKNEAKRTVPEKNRSLLTVERRTPPGPSVMSRTFGLSPQGTARLRDYTLGELAAEGVALEVWSEVLGESLLLVPDTYTPAPEDPVTYTHAEIRVLMGADEDTLRGVHKVKKTFKVRVLGTKETEEAQ